MVEYVFPELLVRWGCRLKGANRSDVDLHLVTHTQEERAGILQSPGFVGNLKVCAGGKLFSGDLKGKRQGQIVICAVKSKCSFHLNL
jgi:hypothetical protein